MGRVQNSLIAEFAVLRPSWLGKRPPWLAAATTDCPARPRQLGAERAPTHQSESLANALEAIEGGQVMWLKEARITIRRRQGLVVRNDLEHSSLCAFGTWKVRNASETLVTQVAWASTMGVVFATSRRRECAWLGAEHLNGAMLVRSQY